MINLATTNAFYRCQYNNPTVQSNFNQALPDYFTVRHHTAHLDYYCTSDTTFHTI